MERIKNLFKTNKKGAMDQVFATIFFIIVFALIVSVFLYTNNLNNPIQQDITSLHIKLDDEENFANLMQSHTDNTNSQTTTNLLVEAIVTNKYSKFDSVLTEKMQRDYVKEIFWEYGVFKINKNDKFDSKSGEIVNIYRNPSFIKPERSPSELETMARFSSDPFGDDPSIMYMQLPLINDDNNYYIVFKFGGSKFRGAE